MNEWMNEWIVYCHICDITVWEHKYFRLLELDLAEIATLPTEVGDGLEEQDMYSP